VCHDESLGFSKTALFYVGCVYTDTCSTILHCESNTHNFLREGPRSQGASWGVCGSGEPPYDFLRQHVPNSGAKSGVSGRRTLLGALARALGDSTLLTGHETHYDG
jgi:hypothetical protein